MSRAPRYRPLNVASHPKNLRPKSSGAHVRQRSEDTESDWLGDEEGPQLASASSPDALPNNVPPFHRRQDPSRGPSISKVSGTAHTVSHPKLRILPSVRQHSIWKDCHARVTSMIEDQKATSSAIRRAETSLQHLMNDTEQWGLVVNENGVGPCVTCLERDTECIVQLEATDAGYGIKYICIACRMAGGRTKACDLPRLPHPGPRKQNQLNAAALASQSEKATSTPMAQKSHRLNPVNPASHSPPSRKISNRGSLPRPVPKPMPSQKSGSPTKSVDYVPHTTRKAGVQVKPRPEESGVQPAQVLAALDDVAEFASNMSEILQERNQMDFMTRGMFRVVEGQIAVIRQSVDQSR